MKNISRLRKTIDQIDRKIVRLLNKRAETAGFIGKLKKEKGQNYYLPHREKEVIRNVRSAAGALPPDAVAEVYEEVLHVCRNLQKKLKIAYLGPDATFTHCAAQKNFGVQAHYLPASSISDVFALVEKEQVDHGVVPIENSTEGIITHTLDMFRSSDLTIIREINLAVHHYLLSNAKSISRIKKIYSHPQAFAQCAGYIKRCLGPVKFVEMSSTAEAALIVRKDRTGAAISSLLASRLYGIPVLAKRIEDLHNNMTRFLVIGRDIPGKTGYDKTSILFSIKDRVGALYDILLPFKRHRINLTKIESRPEKGRAWNYIFYVDFEGHMSDPVIKKVIAGIEENSTFIKILGSYPKAD